MVCWRKKERKKEEGGADLWRRGVVGRG